MTAIHPAGTIDQPIELWQPPGQRWRARIGAVVRGRADDAVWVRPSLLTLLVATALLYLWGLGDSGYANSFYSAAVQAGTHSWKAFFFGSSDSSSFITVDKPPVALWVMGVSARIFGVNSWSILVPQALEGIASVGLLYLTVRRWFTPAAGLIAGAVLALTPVATLMFRFNNPDALLTLLLVASAYALVRSLEAGSTRWLLLCAGLIGTGFLTKMLQAFAVVPVFALVYLLAGPTPVRRRLLQLGAATLALLVASGWWVAIVELTPASDRPYIGGSQDNSLLNLIFGYNGFGRLTGNESGSVGGGGNAAGRWGATGWDRLFGSDMGGQVSWLIPAALILTVAVLWQTRRRARSDRTRAAVLIFGGWLVVTGLLFSYAQGIIHPYYTVALAPAIGALCGIGAVVLWSTRHELLSRLTLAAAVLTTAYWADVLLGRTSSFYPALRIAIVSGGIAAAVGLLALVRLRGRLPLAIGLVALGVGIVGPSAYALSTASTAHDGAIPSAGPGAAGFGGPGGRLAFGRGAFNGQPPGPGAGGFGQRPAGGFAPGQLGPGATAQGPNGSSPQRPATTPGRAGGLLGASSPSKALTELLKADASSYRWVAAAIGSNSAAGYQLASDEPIMAIGGFNGTDPTPTLARFKAYVRAGTIHYFIGSGSGGGRSFGGSGGGPGGQARGGAPQTSSSARQISAWVAANYRSRTVGGIVIYDLASTV